MIFYLSENSLTQIKKLHLIIGEFYDFDIKYHYFINELSRLTISDKMKGTFITHDNRYYNFSSGISIDYIFSDDFNKIIKINKNLINFL